jgi:general stress protein YciG
MVCGRVAAEFVLARVRSKTFRKGVNMESKTRLSGFASMDESKQREIARKGGMAAHRKGTAHEFTAEEARFAGRKGGQQVSANRSHMIEIGRLGGKRSAERRRNRGAADEDRNQAAQTSETSEMQPAGSADSTMSQPGANTEND